MRRGAKRREKAWLEKGGKRGVEDRLDAERPRCIAKIEFEREERCRSGSRPGEEEYARLPSEKTATD